MTLGINVTTRNAMLDAITARAGGSALLRIYDGTRPATGGTPTNLLAQLTCNATFAPGASSGVLTLNSIASATSAVGTGAAKWFRIVSASPTFAHVLDGSVTTQLVGTGDLQLDSDSIVTGGTVAVSSASITAANA